MRYVTCSGLIPSGSACGQESRATALTPEQLTDILRQAVDTAEELGMELDFTSPGWLDEEDVYKRQAQVIAALEDYAGRNEVFDEGLAQLKTVVKYLSSFGVPEENFAVDLTIARGLDYYTGTVYAVSYTHLFRCVHRAGKAGAGVVQLPLHPA